MKTKTVGDVMVTRLATVPPDATLLQVRDIFAHVRFHHLLVVEEGRLVGLISDRDVLRTISPFFGTVNEQPRDAALMVRKVHQIMARQPICATPTISLADAVRTMYRRKISALPVVDPVDGRLLGLLTWKDVVRAHMPEAFAPPEAKETATRESARGYVKAACSSLPAGEDAPRPPSGRVPPPSPRPPSSAHKPVRVATPPPVQPTAGMPAPSSASVVPMRPGETVIQPAPEILAVINAAAAAERRGGANTTEDTHAMPSPPHPPGDTHVMPSTSPSPSSHEREGNGGPPR